MTNGYRVALSLALVVLLGGVVAGFDPGSTNEFARAEQGAVEVSSCATISQPGTYRLTGDIENSTNDVCLSVETGNVTIEGGGNAIDGTNREGQGIAAEYVENVTVRNVETSDWETGLYLNGVEGATVSGVEANSNVDGVFLGDAGNATVRDVTAADNRQYGVYNFRGIDSEFAGIRATGNERGIMAYGENNTYANLTLTRNVEGIWLSSGNDTITESNVSNNAEYGLFLSDSTTNTLADTTLAGNGEDIYLFRSQLTASNVGLGQTVVSFDGRNAVVNGAATESEPPEGLADIGKRVSVRAPFTDASAYLSLNVSYDDGDVSGIDEQTLRIWRFADGWEQVLGPNSVNTETNTVYANLTGFSTEASTYAALGEPGAEQTTTTEVEGTPTPRATTAVERTMTDETTMIGEDTPTVEGATTDEETPTTQRQAPDTATTTLPPTDGVQPNATDATPLSPGESVEGEVTDPQGGNVYGVEAAAGSAITVNFTRTSGNGSLGVYLYDPNARLVSGVIPVAEVGQTTQLTARAEQSGTYYVAVAPVENATGGYMLTTSVSETGMPAPTVLPETTAEANQTSPAPETEMN